MQTGPAGFDAALAARTSLSVSTIAAGQQLTSDSWTVGSEVTVRRELAGELPDAVALTAGSQQSSATVKVDGRMPAAMHPMIHANAVAGLDSVAQVEAGYSNLRVPVFSGRVRELSFDEGDRTITYEARDAADNLTEPAYVPVYGSVARRDRLGSPTRHVTNSQGVIAHVLQQNGIRMVPANRNGCVLSVPLVGGALAEVGWVVPNGGPSPATYLTPGRFGHMPAAGTETYWAYPSTQVRLAAGEHISIDCWYFHTNLVSSNEFIRVQVEFGDITVSVASNRVYVYVRATPGGAQLQLIGTTTIVPGWHHFSIELDRDSLARLFVDGVLTETRSGTWGSSLPAVAPIDYALIVPGRVQHVTMHRTSGATSLTPPAPSIMDFTSQADLDVGVLELGATPNVDGRDSWDVLKEIAAAELGMVGFSENGRFFFKRLSSLRAATAPVATWDLDYAKGVAGSVTLDGVRSVATAKATPLTLVDSGVGNSSPETTAVPSMLGAEVLELTPTLGVPAQYLVTGDQPWVPTQRALSIITLASGAWNALTGMALCRDVDGVTRYTGAGVGAWWSPLSQTTWVLNVVNTESFSVFTAWPKAWTAEGGYVGDVPFGLRAGSPAIWANGRSLPKDIPARAVEVVKASTVTAWGRRVLDMGESPYWQDPEIVEAFLGAVLDGTASPRPQMSDVTLPADPRWQLGDPITLHDSAGVIPDRTARITRIQLVINRDVEHGIEGTYSLRAI